MRPARSGREAIRDGAAHMTLPRTRGCFVCGAENERGLRLSMRLEEGWVVGDREVPLAEAGYRGLWHGGLAATLMDEAMTWAAILASRRVCVAASMAIRFLRPMAVGRRYRFRGRVVRSTSRLLATEAEILDEEGRAMARAEGKYIPIRQPAALGAADFYDPLPAGLEWLGAEPQAEPSSRASGAEGAS